MPKYIDGIRVSNNTEDMRGRKFGRLLVKSMADRSESGRLKWTCTCECGNETTILADQLRSGKTRSCGCMGKTNARKHGYCGTPEHSAWVQVKKRCFYDKRPEYENYARLGMSDEFANDFVAFLDHIGPIPESILGTTVSVDRIDNSKGYERGNVRWADWEMQARNRGKWSTNKSGITGVSKTTYPNGRSYWVAAWCNLERKVRSKKFSIDKYGDELAFFAACEMRELMIERLNMQGAGYTEIHGK